MQHAITVRNVNAEDKAWLRREARSQRISMEELVRRLIRREKERSERRESIADAFERYFGPKHGVDLPERQSFGFRAPRFDDD